jgi:hypothetical protein
LSGPILESDLPGPDDIYVSPSQILSPSAITRFNLGHGILPNTPIAHVERLIARVGKNHFPAASQRDLAHKPDRRKLSSALHPRRSTSALDPDAPHYSLIQKPK